MCVASAGVNHVIMGMVSAIRRRRRLSGGLSAGAFLAIALTWYGEVAGDSVGGPSIPSEDAAEEFFESQIRPLLVNRCQKCHGESKAEGGLRLTDLDSLRRGGDSGPTIVPGDPDASLLIDAVEQRGELRMPPNGMLSDQERSALREWVRGGGTWPKARSPDSSSGGGALATHWSYRSLARPMLPRVSDGARRQRTPVDAFILAQLEPWGLTLSSDANTTTLLRRVSFDLTGLPPSPALIEEFLHDRSPDAYARLVDRLMSTPAFGERWGRHWLDVSGYVDTLGYDVNIAQFMRLDNKWFYRDYVVKAFNGDRPYDQFLREQLAGDELTNWRSATQYTPSMLEPLIATGYLRNAEDRTDEAIAPPLKRYEVLYDTMQIFGSNLLGLSLQCARCHDHKYEPVSQEDYYRLMAVFTPAFNPEDWKTVHTRPLADVPPNQKVVIDEHNQQLDKELAQLNERAETVKRTYAPQVMETRVKELPETIREDVRRTFELDPNQRDEVQKYLAQKFKSLPDFSLDDAAPFLSQEDRAVRDEIAAARADLAGKRRSYGIFQAVYDVGQPPATYVLHRGDHESPEREVPPGLLGVLSSPQTMDWMPPNSTDAVTSGRRTALARWITDPRSPASALVARITVNRLWAHLTGRGIVPTQDNFGVTGMPPSHPDLLEWLAAEFVDGGWHVKPLLRTILLSTTYRQSTGGGAEPFGGHADSQRSERVDPELVDPANTLLWKMRLRRLESECVRDAMLTASGLLNPRVGGAPVMTVVRPDGMTVIEEDKLEAQDARWRKSLYLLNRRQCNLSFLSVFDQPSINVNCAARQSSAVPLQSLAMMNSQEVWEQAGHLAQRVIREGGSTPADQIAWAVQLTLSRRPDPEEVLRMSEFLQRQHDLLRSDASADDPSSLRALVNLCQTLLGTNEFLYVE